MKLAGLSLEEGGHPPSLQNGDADSRRNEVLNADENHEVGFYLGPAPGSVLADAGGLPTRSAIGGFCRCYLGCLGGISLGEANLGDCFCRYCRTFQSLPALDVLSRNVSVAGSNIHHYVPGFIGGNEGEAETCDAIHCNLSPAPHQM